LDRFGAVVQFDHRASRIGNEGESGAGLRILVDGALDLHADPWGTMIELNDRPEPIQ